MKTGKLYRQVFIESEDDLPKEKGIYIVKCADNDTPEFMRLAGYGGNIFWNKVTWYLVEQSQQIEKPSDDNDVENAIEHIFKNTERIHGKSEALDWIKIASHRTVEYFKHYGDINLNNR